MRLARTEISCFLVLVLSTSGALAQQESNDLARGILQVEQRDFEGAVLTLDPIARGLVWSKSEKDIARARLYLGIALLELGQDAKAREQFKDAVRLEPGMKPEGTPRRRSAMRSRERAPSCSARRVSPGIGRAA